MGQFRCARCIPGSLFAQEGLCHLTGAVPLLCPPESKEPPGPMKTTCEAARPLLGYTWQHTINMAPPQGPLAVSETVAAPLLNVALTTGFPENSNTKPHMTCTPDGAIIMDRFQEANRTCINRKDMLWYERTREKHPQMEQMKAKIATRHRLYEKLTRRRACSDS